MEERQKVEAILKILPGNIPLSKPDVIRDTKHLDQNLPRKEESEKEEVECEDS